MADIGKLLRLKQTIDAAANVQVSTRGARELVSSYNRLYEATLGMATELGLQNEFVTLFTPLGLPAGPPSFDKSSAEAKMMLAQLGGWIDGIIAEQTLGARIKAEAEARVSSERGPIGFSAE